MCLGPFDEGCDREDRVVASGAARLRESDERRQADAENERGRLPRCVERGDDNHETQGKATYE